MVRWPARSLSVAGTLCLGCVGGPALHLSPRDAAELASVPEIPVVYRKAPPPSVFCPGDVGRQTFESPGAMNGNPEPPSPAIADLEAGTVRLVSADEGLYRLAGDFWEDYVDDVTKPLQVPPVDPVQATARSFLALAGEGRAPLPFGRDVKEVASARPEELSRLFGTSPVLVFNASEWLLVGCFQTFDPWFNVRAKIVDPATGRVVWRKSCRGGMPSGGNLNVSTLAASGGALYARLIHDRALECSREIFASLESDRGAAIAGAR